MFVVQKREKEKEKGKNFAGVQIRAFLLVGTGMARVWGLLTLPLLHVSKPTNDSPVLALFDRLLTLSILFIKV